jgi:FdrA protein
MTSATRISNLLPARTLSECALLAAQIVQPEIGDVSKILKEENTRLDELARRLKAEFKPAQRYLRGLFSGGTLCYEAQVIWKDIDIQPIYSNAPLPGGQLLPDSTRSSQHSAVDLGEEEFTVGRPHPMIDNDLRIRRMLQEARDPQVGLILLDVVLGFGAHPDPASELAKAVKETRKLCLGENREILVIASVTGTENDPQGLGRSISILKNAGVIVCNSNAAAARLAGSLVSN